MIENKPLFGKSEIYMITNHITGKQYIGQTKCYYNNKKDMNIMDQKKDLKHM